MNGEGVDVATFFNGAYVNEFHQSGRPFFENAREVKMRSVKYAPCKFCVLHKVQEGNTVAEQVDFNNLQSGTTVIQSLGKLLYVQLEEKVHNNFLNPSVPDAPKWRI